MGVSYLKLRELIVKHRLKLNDLKKYTGLSNTLVSKINKDEYIMLDKLELICKYLEYKLNRKIDFSDILERTWEDE